MSKRIRCKLCQFICFSNDEYVSHLEDVHMDSIPEDMDGWQFLYYLKTGKTHGNCVMCKSPTTWNTVTHKYNRFCDKKSCKDRYRELFKTRMTGKYGKTTLLNDPEQQKKMLANRKISGKYIWRDRVHESTYTGSYEKSFLEFLDKVLGFNPDDVVTPSPHTYWYTYEGKRHFYIPDLFIPSLNLEIEIKDGGDNPNMHQKIQSVDKVKEALKDEVMKTSSLNYLKITNKNNKKFLDFLEKNKYNDEPERPIIMTESSEPITTLEFVRNTLENLKELTE